MQYDETAILVNNILYEFQYSKDDKYISLLPNNFSYNIFDLFETKNYCKNSEYLFVDSYQSIGERIIINGNNRNNSVNRNNNVCCLGSNSCADLNVTVIDNDNDYDHDMTQYMYASRAQEQVNIYCAGKNSCGSFFSNINSLIVQVTLD